MIIGLSTMAGSTETSEEAPESENKKSLLEGQGREKEDMIVVVNKKN